MRKCKIGIVGVGTVGSGIFKILTSNCVSTIPLTRAEWDIPLSGFITEKEIFV